MITEAKNLKKETTTFLVEREALKMLSELITKFTGITDITEVKVTPQTLEITHYAKPVGEIKAERQTNGFIELVNNINKAFEESVKGGGNNVN